MLPLSFVTLATTAGLNTVTSMLHRGICKSPFMPSNSPAAICQVRALKVFARQPPCRRCQRLAGPAGRLPPTLYAPKRRGEHAMQQGCKVQPLAARVSDTALPDPPKGAPVSPAGRVLRAWRAEADCRNDCGIRANAACGFGGMPCFLLRLLKICCAQLVNRRGAHEPT